MDWLGAYELIEVVIVELQLFIKAVAEVGAGSVPG
jgi:hypothetical protein